MMMQEEFAVILFPFFLQIWNIIPTFFGQFHANMNIKSFRMRDVGSLEP